MMQKLFLFVICFPSLFIFDNAEGTSTFTKQIYENVTINQFITHEAQYSEKLSPVYCFSGIDRHLIHLWSSVELFFVETPNQFKLFHHFTVTQVLKQKSSWFALDSFEETSIRLPSFQSYCFAVQTKEKFSIKLHIIRKCQIKLQIQLTKVSILFF